MGLEGAGCRALRRYLQDFPAKHCMMLGTSPDKHNRILTLLRTTGTRTRTTQDVCCGTDGWTDRRVNFPVGGGRYPILPYKNCKTAALVFGSRFVKTMSPHDSQHAVCLKGLSCSWFKHGFAISYAREA